MKKRVLFIANSLNNAFKFQQVLASLDVEVTAGSTLQIKRLFSADGDVNLVIFEAGASAWGSLPEVQSYAENKGCALLVIADECDIGRLNLPANLPCDFVSSAAENAECAIRIRRLLGEKASGKPASIIAIDGMVINLATYQVTVAGEPIDFTYLEYALLAYLVQHPNRTFPRETLIEHVWGFDYNGGARTVDVHVRRIRAKLGPSLAQYIETVRGVGYLWKTR